MQAVRHRQDINLQLSEVCTEITGRHYRQCISHGETGSFSTNIQYEVWAIWQAITITKMP